MKTYLYKSILIHKSDLWVWNRKHQFFILYETFQFPREFKCLMMYIFSLQDLKWLQYTKIEKQFGVVVYWFFIIFVKMLLGNDLSSMDIPEQSDVAHMLRLRGGHGMLIFSAGSCMFDTFCVNAPICFNTFQAFCSIFYTPWKRQKTFGFLTFSGGTENTAEYWKALK